MVTVADLMTANPCAVSPETPLIDVLGMMKTHQCRQLPVVLETGELVGIITDRDVRLALNSPLTLHERTDDITLLQTVTVEACMTPDPLTVEPDTPAVKAAELLYRHKFGALPVVVEDKVVGIITVTDLLRYMVESNKPG